MPINEHDREDLLRDGRQMPLRGESEIGSTLVVIGFRPAGQVSLYCGQDPVFQFNARGQLRRAYFQGRRFAADRGRLVELNRVARGGRIQFDSQPADAPTQQAMITLARQWLERIAEAARAAETPWRVVGGPAKTFCQRLQQWLAPLAEQLPIADEPNA